MALSFTPDSEDAGQRVDHYLQKHLAGYSRSRLQSWIKDGRVHVNGAVVKASAVLRGGERIEVSPEDLAPLKATPEDLPVEILYEDASVMAINKPAGLVVHAGAGTHSGTLVNRLVHRFAALSHLGGDLRPGIVHRLDKGTSGVLLVARTDAAHRALAAQFSGRTVEKTYLALVHGAVRADSGRITAPIARDPVRRTRMTARLATGREALTDYRVLERLGKFSYLEVRIGTGRTHQIRVHLASIGHPVAGDRLYGAPAATAKATGSFPGAAAPERVFLHAARIVFTNPETGQRIAVEAPLPAELTEWFAAIKLAV